MPQIPENIAYVARKRSCAFGISPDGTLLYAPVWGIALEWPGGEVSLLCAAGSIFTHRPPAIELIWEYIHSAAYRPSPLITL
jgi:hypothetical protein